jgi:hypothetical protein
MLAAQPRRDSSAATKNSPAAPVCCVLMRLHATYSATTSRSTLGARPRPGLTWSGDRFRSRRHSPEVALRRHLGPRELAYARDQYSDYLLRELDDEIAKHVPDYREHLEVLKSLGNIQFHGPGFRRRVARSSGARRQGLAGGPERTVRVLRDRVFEVRRRWRRQRLRLAVPRQQGAIRSVC